MTTATRGTPDRFWARVERTTGCWLWTGAIDQRTGYGRLQYQGRQVTAHRLAFELATGAPPPAELYVCHSCDTRLCCRPDHLWLGSAAENTRDAVSKGRMHPGEQHPGARLTADQVATIRDRLSSGERGTDVAAHFGVHPNTVYAIGKGRTWAGQ